MPSDTLYTRAGELLAYATGLLTGITTAYVALADPALDCPDQVTVHVNSLARGDIGLQASRADFEYGTGKKTGALNEVGLVLTVVRCAPTQDDRGQSPTPLAYEAAAGAILADLWLLWKGIPRGIASGALWPGACEGFRLGPAQPIPEQGGFAGWQIQFTGELLVA